MAGQSIWKVISSGSSDLEARIKKKRCKTSWEQLNKKFIPRYNWGDSTNLKKRLMASCGVDIEYNHLPCFHSTALTRRPLIRALSMPSIRLNHAHPIFLPPPSLPSHHLSTFPLPALHQHKPNRFFHLPISVPPLCISHLPLCPPPLDPFLL